MRTRPPSSITADTGAECVTTRGNCRARNAATSASRTSAHSDPIRSLNRSRCAGLIEMPASSRKSALASSNDDAFDA